jgi:hypothetical protein
VAGGWFGAGKTLGVALDLDAGTLLVSVDGAAWTVAFADGCAPSAAVGAALFPALSGSEGAQVRCNWGADAGRPMKHGPPSGEYCAVGLAMQVLLSPAALSCTPVLAPPPPFPFLLQPHPYKILFLRSHPLSCELVCACTHAVALNSQPPPSQGKCNGSPVGYRMASSTRTACGSQRSGCSNTHFTESAKACAAGVVTVELAGRSGRGGGRAGCSPPGAFVCVTGIRACARACACARSCT